MGTRALPTGTVTFLFTDVEGSTRLLHSLGSEAYADALAAHRRILRDAFARHGGVEVDTQGDAFFVAFPTAPGALAAAREATDALAGGPIRVRIGIHTGTPLLTDEGYVGPDVHRAARIAAAGHGGQILVSSAAAALLDRTALRDLGDHRLKDLAAPERIFQADDGQHPPLKSLYQTNLPVPATPFLGRRAELAELTALLNRDEVRLVTLTGTGGTGKTRLALQAAADAADAFPDGVWWVPLAPLRDPELVLPTAAQAIGAAGDLAEHIGDRRLLLLLDNFEHVVSAADGLSPLLGACPNLTLLVTSREPLRLAGEHEVAVDPLTRDDAVELFLTRAVAARRDFTANGEVARICERLDHLPLAIELAAARVKLMSPGALLERLEQRLPLLAGGARDLPERQRTLRATIAWSHELLTDDEQRLFARLAVFRGGWTLDAAEAVAGADLDTLGSLVDKSLVRVRPDSDRFWMLETIREFALEHLQSSGEADDVRDRHADYFLGLAEHAYAERHTAEERWAAVVGGNTDNLRAALEPVSKRDPRGHAALASALSPYWHLSGLGPEAARHLGAALDHLHDRDAVRARALTHAGLMRYMTDPAGPAAGQEDLTEALAIWRELGDVRGEALALENHGFLHLAAAELAAARSDFEESLALRERAGASLLEAQGSVVALCQLLVAAGDAAAAEPLAEQLYELGTEHRSPSIRADALHFLADCPLLTGDYPEAERRYLRALEHAWEQGMALQATNEMIGIAMSAAGQGDPARALRLATAAYEQRTRLGLPRISPMGFWRRLQDRYIGATREQLSPADLDEAEAAGAAVPFESIVDEVLQRGPG